MQERRVSPPDGASATPPDSVSPDLKGRRLVFGRATRLRLARLLGLDRPPIDYRIVSVEWRFDHLEVDLRAAAGGSETIVALEGSRPDLQAFIRGPEVSLWIRERDVPARLEATLLGVAARHLSGLRLSGLERLLLGDPEVLEEPVRESRSAEASEAAIDGISLPTAGRHALEAMELYADFFAAPEFRRAGCDIIDVHSAHSLVCHGDVECSYCAVWIPQPRSALLRLPVYETVRNVGRLPNGRGRFRESEDLLDIFSSDMNERDVIMGCPGKLDQVLRHADRHRQKDSILVIGACLPDVIGEDQQAAVESFAGTTSTPVVMVPPSPRSWSWLARDFLHTRRRALSVGVRPDGSAINLIGFARNQGTRDLEALLADLDVTVNALVIPELSLEAIGRLPEGALNVYLPNVYWEGAYQHLRDDDERKHLELDGPYGLAATERWLGAVCASLGLDRDVAAPCRRRFEQLEPRWLSSREEAGRYRLGLVVSARDVGPLVDTRCSWGIPLLAAIREMGFGLDVFVGGEHGAESAAILRDRTELDDPAVCGLHEFDSLETMLSAIRDSECRAVFSNYVFDWRLPYTGKAPFSTLEFEMGLAGALLTQERLLRICRLALFRGGRRFFSHTRERRGGHDG